MKYTIILIIFIVICLPMDIFGQDLPQDNLAFNAMMTVDGDVVPIYRVRDPQSQDKAIAFIQNGELVSAINLQNNEIWKIVMGEGVLLGGFDYNCDGWPDCGIRKKFVTEKICGQKNMHITAIELFSGKTGERIPIPGCEPLEDTCWDFGHTVYPAHQWSPSSILFGEGETIAAVPVYAQTAYFSNKKSNNFSFFYFPSTANYDHYPAAAQNPYGHPHSYIANSHMANGIIIEVNNARRLVFFTSARVVQYLLPEAGLAPLLFDRPFLPGNRKDLAGRNYGLVMKDPYYAQNIVLISGASTLSMYKDKLSGSMSFDPWGGVERHVAVYNYLNNEIEDRFYSCAHDNNDGNKYQDRVLYANNAFLPAAQGPSHLVYNVYSKGHWFLHISLPGSTQDKYVLKDLFLWDVRDINNDGIHELIISRTRYPHEPDVAGYYFPKWEVAIYQWDKKAQTLISIKVYDGAIPYIQPQFRSAGKSNLAMTNGCFFPVLTILRNNELELVLYNSEKQIKTFIVDY